MSVAVAWLALLVGCAPAPQLEPDARADAPPAALVVVPDPSAPPPATPPPLETAVSRGPAHRELVPSFDDHPLAVWTKRPANPRGAFLLLHGRTWSGVPDFDLQVEGEHLSLMDHLLERGYAAYALDLRGYGGTTRDPSGWNHPDKAAKDTIAAMEWIASREGFPAVVLGWSYGSISAHIAVQRRPDLAQAVVLYGHPRHPRGRSQVLPDPPAPDRAANSKNGARTDFITRGTISEHAVDTYAAACFASDPVRADWYRVHEFDEADPRKLAVPTLLIRGEGDPVANPEHQRLLLTYLTVPSRLVEIPNADHAAHLEHPERFLDEVLSFTATYDPKR